MAVIERAGEESVSEIVERFPVLKKHKVFILLLLCINLMLQDNIHVVPIAVKNDVSSTVVRSSFLAHSIKILFIK